MRLPTVSTMGRRLDQNLEKAPYLYMHDCIYKCNPVYAVNATLIYICRLTFRYVARHL